MENSSDISSLEDKIKKLRAEFDSEILDVKEEIDISRLKSKYIGKKGLLQDLFKIIPQFPEPERKSAGKILNEFKEYVEERLESLKTTLERKQVEFSEDITLPGRRNFSANLHPITIALREITGIFEKIGFEVESGPEIEEDWYNFTALNIPQDHPARDMQDTFYLDDGRLLRTHTSPVQIRAMMKRKGILPIKIIAPGRVFRRDWDATHSPVFHQVEGLFVDRKVRMSDLFGVLEFFFKKFFGERTQVRFRPSYFPFTEPSAEVDISCICGGKSKDCKVCKGSGFLEVAGCGMVHPEVFKSVGYEGVQGFAFGMGVERLAMIKFGISDIRLLFGENYIAFKKSFF